MTRLSFSIALSSWWVSERFFFRGVKRKATWGEILVERCGIAEREIYRGVICKADRMYPAGGESGSQGVISGTKAGAATSGTKLVEN